MPHSENVLIMLMMFDGDESPAQYITHDSLFSMDASSLSSECRLSDTISSALAISQHRKIMQRINSHFYVSSPLFNGGAWFTHEWDFIRALLCVFWRRYHCGNSKPAFKGVEMNFRLSCSLFLGKQDLMHISAIWKLWKIIFSRKIEERLRKSASKCASKP